MASVLLLSVCRYSSTISKTNWTLSDIGLAGIVKAYGLIDQAKQQFILSNDEILISLIDSCSKNSNKDLNIDIVNYFLDVKDNKIAQNFILDTVKKDIQSLKQSFGEIKENFKNKSKEIKGGK